MSPRTWAPPLRYWERLGCLAAGGRQAWYTIPEVCFGIALQGLSISPGGRPGGQGQPTTSSPSWWPSSRPVRSMRSARAGPGRRRQQARAAPPRPRTCRRLSASRWVGDCVFPRGPPGRPWGHRTCEAHGRSQLLQAHAAVGALDYLDGAWAVRGSPCDPKIVCRLRQPPVSVPESILLSVRFLPALLHSRQVRNSCIFSKFSFMPRK